MLIPDVAEVKAKPCCSASADTAESRVWLCQWTERELVNRPSTLNGRSAPSVVFGWLLVGAPFTSSAQAFRAVTLSCLATSPRRAPRPSSTLPSAERGCSPFASTLRPSYLPKPDWHATDPSAACVRPRRPQLASIAFSGECVEEELWLALRALPAAAASLLRLREPSTLSTEDGAPPRMETALAQLNALPLHTALRDAQMAHARRLGPAPTSLGAYAALLLAASAAFELDMVTVLPRSAPIIRQSREAMVPPLLDEIHWVEAQLKLMLQTQRNDCCGCKA
eukprot:6185632-Pleurochrysis_carterae.AAC.1